MKQIMQNFCPFDQTKFSKAIAMVVILLFTINHLQAQSGGWDISKQWVNGAASGTGYTDYGNGVILLADSNNSGCEGAAIRETSDKYNPCTGNFNKCYQVLFGCKDSGGDGMAFTFSKCGSGANDYQVWGCGGGLGYANACGSTGITIEFDTYNNTGGDGFDNVYEGTGTQDQIAIHKDLRPQTDGKLAGAAVNNLEDGQEHRVCISYNNTSHELSVTIDGATAISYDMDLAGAGMDMQSYFGGSCDGIEQTWSAGTLSALNQQAVSSGAGIQAQAGKLCPQMVLPIELLSFTGKLINETVVLDWATVMEINNQKFIIERSTNLTEWEVLGEQKGAGNSNTTIPYTFTDHSLPSGTLYYRLRQIDFDGKFSYSNIVVIKTGPELVSISPNPFEEAFTIHSNLTEEMEVSIYDVVGRLLYQVNRKTENGILNIQPELSSGAYFVTIRTDAMVEQWKIIKK